MGNDVGTVSRSAVLAQMDCILATEEFAASPKIQTLLRYIVTATLNEQGDAVKGYTIGIDVFDRDTSFDPITDSIVRVQMGRLRKMLSYYYATAQTPGSVLIDIPKGQYAALFTALEQGDVTTLPDHADAVAATPREFHWPDGSLTIAVLIGITLVVAAMLFFQPPAKAPVRQLVRPQIAFFPFTISTHEAATTAFANDLHEAMAASLTRQKLFSIVMPSRTDEWHSSSAPKSNDVPSLLHVDGLVRRNGTDLQVRVQLVKTGDEQLLWSAVWDRKATDSSDIRLLAADIARELHLRTILAVRDSMSGDPRANDTPWLLYLNAAWVPGEAEDSLKWEEERVAFARRAVKLDPEFGPAHAVLADKLAYLANVDTTLEASGARQEAMQHARQALKLASDDPNVVGNLANHYWHMGDMAMSEKMARRTVALDPDNALAAFQATVHPYSCERAPQQIVDEAKQFDASLTGDNPTRWVTQTWLNQLYLNNDDLPDALAAGRKSFVIFRTPDTSLRLAATLVATGKVVEAQETIQTIAPNWPHLNLFHYADTTMPRRCGNQSEARRMVALYKNMAKAICTRMPSSPVCAHILK